MRIALRACGKTFPQPDGSMLTVLDDVDLDIDPGEVVALVGRSGSGKSTLLHLLGLLTEPTRGEYLIDGYQTSRMGERQRAALRGRAFGFVFQDHMLLPKLDVTANVLLPFAHGGSLAGSQRQRAGELLDRVGLGDRGRSLPGQLSGGQRQRVAIARALARRPEVVLADEPTGSLDPATAAGVLELLSSLVSERGASLVLVTHDAAVASIAGRVLAVEAGALVEAAPLARTGRQGGRP